MPDGDPTLLLPMVDKLLQHSPMTHEEQRALLALPASVKTADRNRYLVREEQGQPSCIVILDGFAYRSKLAGDGGRQILSFDLQGDVTNLQGCLLGHADYSVQALTAVRFGSISTNAMMDVANAHPGVALALRRDTMIDSSLSMEWMLNIGRRDARQRIAHLICEIARRQQAVGISRGPTFEWPLTQIDVADATGLTNVHVNRMLKDLQRHGLIQLDRGSVTINDWAAFAKIADFDDAYLHLSSSDLQNGVVDNFYNQSISLGISSAKMRAEAA